MRLTGNRICVCITLQNKGDTHVAERFDRWTSAAAVAHTGPTPRARRDS